MNGEAHIQRIVLYDGNEFEIERKRCTLADCDAHGKTNDEIVGNRRVRLVRVRHQRKDDADVSAECVLRGCG